MEPIFSYSGLNVTFVELILACALVLLGALIAIWVVRRGAKSMSAEQMQAYLSKMAEQQSSLQGRLSQFAEDSASREEKLRKILDERLDIVSHKVGQSLHETQERSAKNLKDLHERLALIDRAQKNIETLSGEVSSLQSLLSNKQARGAFGEKAMQDLIENFLPPSAYDFQVVLSNGKRVDALIHLPGEQGHVAVDSKFPMESWRRLTAAETAADKLTYGREFRRDVLVHIKDIASKYLIFGETYEIALLFLPSEAIYAELHTNFSDVVDKGFSERVMIVSPTTFMATLHTMRALMKDAAMREQAHIIQKEVGALANDVRLLSERATKLQTHFRQVGDDVTGILTSSQKITNRSDKIGSLEMQENKEEPEPDLLDKSPDPLDKPKV
ncbi:MAG: DNA recombination protein RmuC [Robiginitomaculum sp.]|nr:MAG: DNA recombination protein RmuC [Robiginitomaculum sp.]